MNKHGLVLAWAALGLATGCAGVGGTNCTRNADGTADCVRTSGPACNAVADEVARTIVTRGCGQPAYAGQALMIENCASCHVQATPADMAASLMARRGAPAGLDFDPHLVDPAEGDPILAAQRLRRAQSNIHEHRELIYASLVEGNMPPRGVVAPGAPSAWRFADGSRLPRLSDPEGQEMLRRWLSCGSPVIETTVATRTTCTANSECTVTNVCDTGRGECTRVGDIVESGETPTTANWSSIWCVVQTRCGDSCHIGAAQGSFELPAGDAPAARAALLAGRADPSTCVGGMPYVVPNQPDESVLVQRLEAPMCSGSRMPLGGDPLPATQITAIRQWIEAGALDD